jgi:hypothetical protein
LRINTFSRYRHDLYLRCWVMCYLTLGISFIYGLMLQGWRHTQMCTLTIVYDMTSLKHILWSQFSESMYIRISRKRTPSWWVGLDWFYGSSTVFKHVEPPRAVGRIECDTGICPLVLLRAFSRYTGPRLILSSARVAFLHPKADRFGERAKTTKVLSLWGWLAVGIEPTTYRFGS